MSCSCRSKKTSNVFETIPVDILNHLATFMRNFDRIRFIRASKALCVQLCKNVRKSDPWCIKWEAYLHMQWSFDGQKWPVRGLIPRVVSRTCRSCGKYTERRVFSTPLCEKCTRNTANKWHMISVASLGKKWRPGLVRAHSGRRGLLVFKHDIDKAFST